MAGGDEGDNIIVVEVAVGYSLSCTSVLMQVDAVLIATALDLVKREKRGIERN